MWCGRSFDVSGWQGTWSSDSELHCPLVHIRRATLVPNQPNPRHSKLDFLRPPTPDHPSPNSPRASRRPRFHIRGLANINMAAYYANDSVLTHATSLYPYGQHDEPDSQAQSSTIYNLPTDSEGEAEVDELESDSESEQGTSASATQKKEGKRMGERVLGTTLLPISRVENIIQADGMSRLPLRNGCCWCDFTSVFQGITTNLSMSKEASFVLSIATVYIAFVLCDSGVYTTLQEEFIKRMVQAGHRQASASRQSSVNYVDMGQPSIACTRPLH